MVQAQTYYVRVSNSGPYLVGAELHIENIIISIPANCSAKVLNHICLGGHHVRTIQLPCHSKIKKDNRILFNKSIYNYIIYKHTVFQHLCIYSMVLGLQSNKEANAHT